MQFWLKNDRVRAKKFYAGKIFDFDIFGLNTFWNILNRFRPKKIFRPKLFDFVIFSLFWPKRDRVRAKNLHGKIFFDFEIFILKYVLTHSGSIPTKKKSTNFFYWAVFTILVILAEKRFRPKIFLPIFYDLAIFSLFWPFWPKNDRVRAKKNLHGKNFRFHDFRFKIRFETF